jgi:integrase
MAKKNAPGEGNLFFSRKRRRWRGRLSLGWENGRRKTKDYWGVTQAEVLEQLSKARYELSRGLPIATERQSVRQFLDRWLEESVKPSVRPKTFEQYEQHSRLYLKPSLGRHELTRLLPEHVETFINERLKSGLAPRTVQLSLVILRHALKHAIELGQLARNVAKLVKGPKVRRRETTWLDPEQARKFLEAARGERLEALYSVALSLGLREGEALALRWTDVDFNAGQLSVCRTLQRVGGERFGGEGSRLVFQEPKSERSHRTLRMPETLIRALRRHRSRQLQERLAAGSAWMENDLAFPTAIGTALEPRSLVKDFKRILKKAGLPAVIRFHDLRHSAASLLLAQGVQLRTIMELLGHSSIAITANLYAHVSPPLLREAADKMDAILG